MRHRLRRLVVDDPILRKRFQLQPAPFTVSFAPALSVRANVYSSEQWGSFYRESKMGTRKFLVNLARTFCQVKRTFKALLNNILEITFYNHQN